MRWMLVVTSVASNFLQLQTASGVCFGCSLKTRVFPNPNSMIMEDSDGICGLGEMLERLE